MRRLVVVVVLAALFVGVGASAAFAGEVTGKGKVTGAPANANSECSFSGLEDGSEGTPEARARLRRTGQISLGGDRDFLTSIGVNPGNACNGSKNPLKKGRQVVSCWEAPALAGASSVQAHAAREARYTPCRRALPSEFPVPAEHGCREVT